MVKKIFYFIAFLSILCHASMAQAPEKKPLNFDAFTSWNRILDEAISNDGHWVVYQIKPVKGDPKLGLYNTESKQTQFFSRGSNPQFSEDNQFLVFQIAPFADTLRHLKRIKADDENFPKDTLAIFNLQNQSLELTPNVKKFLLPEKWSNWIAFQKFPSDSRFMDRDSLVRPTKKESKENGSQLTLQQLSTGKKYTLDLAKDFIASEEGKQFIASTTGDGKDLKPGVYWFDTQNNDSQFAPLHVQEGEYHQLLATKDGKKVAFLLDEGKEEDYYSNVSVIAYLTDEIKKVPVATNQSTFLSKNWLISEHGSLDFSENGDKLYFGIAPKLKVQDSTLLEDEMVQVEVWHYQDPVLYPQQKVQLNKEKKRSFTCVYHFNDDKTVQLGQSDIPEIGLIAKGNSEYVFGYGNKQYLQSITWEGGPSRKDLYLINTYTGKSQNIGTGIRGNINSSPGGKYLYWYNIIDTAYFAYDIATNQTIQLTNNQLAPFYDELNDRPNYPSPYGIAGWTTNDDYIIIYDRYDLWLIDPKGHHKTNNMTRSRADKKVMRYIKQDPEETAIEEASKMLLHFFDEHTKEEGYIWYDIHTTTKRVLQQDAYRYSKSPLKAKSNDTWVFTKENFQEFPNLWITNDLMNTEQITDANPQQSEYKWGSAELFEWTSLDGQRLQGLLIKPDNFDPNKKYPLIVNFYERNSHRLHYHRPPYPNRSQITYAFYASRDYVVFNPDIPYRIGYPGESAYNAVVSGTSALINEGFIDKSRIGLQGHSWGGYQIADILTRTDLFKCAESGAPVVNMISAYGGIRWGTGLSRMFQYEKTQSRIGGTLWEMPLRYLENSPIFNLDKINTPVLIMHNDNDSAVPWYQGIEFFMGMRRLNKPAWLLNYNDEPHWPLKLENRIDFQIRMSQFFDHYLLGKPMPEWMIKGVPAIEKGLSTGY